MAISIAPSLAEPRAIDNCKSLFSNRVIPYIEIINSTQSKSYEKTSNTINGILHFEQIYRTDDSDLSSVIELTNDLIKDNVIPSIHFIKKDSDNYQLNTLYDFIDNCHTNNHNCAIRLYLGYNPNSIIDLSKKLNKNDYIIIDIDENNYYSSSLYLDELEIIKNRCNLIIFSNERPNKLSNSKLKDNDYNDSFNVSLIDSINNNDFIGDGFGSYCSAKNDLIESIPNKNAVYGIFIIYNYNKNQFFSMKTQKKDHLSRVYGQFRDSIMNDENTKEIIKSLFKDTPISKKMIDDFINSEKRGNASTYICFSLVHYIEEIVNNINY